MNRGILSIVVFYHFHFLSQNTNPIDKTIDKLQQIILPMIQARNEFNHYTSF